MFVCIKDDLNGGKQVLSKSIEAHVHEGALAGQLEKIQDNHPDVDIGSYPFFREGKLGTCLVVRSSNKTKLDVAVDVIDTLLSDISANSS